MFPVIARVVENNNTLVENIKYYLVETGYKKLNWIKSEHWAEECCNLFSIMAKMASNFSSVITPVRYKYFTIILQISN